MNAIQRQDLLDRLDAIGRWLAKAEKALALIGLGSAGAEQERMDAFSDLDFFVIAKPGEKAGLIANLDWLSGVCPLAYAFQNTPDGWKALYEDGIFCEFAVFEAGELAQVAFAAPRLVWCDPDYDPAQLVSTPKTEPAPRNPVEWIVGEALTNLLVGLGRYRRGEKLSAARFVQGYAVDRVVELAAALGKAGSAFADPFAPERRFELRFPSIAAQLPAMMQGYERTPQSALAVLTFLETQVEVPPVLSARIRALCSDDILEAR